MSETVTEFDPRQHLMDLKGRDYLPVAARILWFRSEHPTWSIITEPLTLDLEAKVAVFRATIMGEDGRLLATAHAVETVAGFKDYLEKAETSAVGRALGLLGYGTLGAMDEGQVADTPQDRGPRPESQGDRRATQQAPETSSLRCEQAGCVTILTSSQATLSRNKCDGRLLCPTHQRKPGT